MLSHSKGTPFLRHSLCYASFFFLFPHHFGEAVRITWPDGGKNFAAAEEKTPILFAQLAIPPDPRLHGPPVSRWRGYDPLCRSSFPHHEGTIRFCRSSFPRPPWLSTVTFFRCEAQPEGKNLQERTSGGDNHLATSRGGTCEVASLFELSVSKLVNWERDSPDVGRGKKQKSKASRTGRGKRMEMVRKGMGILRTGMGIIEYREKGYLPSALEGMGMLWKRIEMLQKEI